jgi:hypothetical protein
VVTVSASDLAKIAESITDRIKVGWKWAFWQELMKTEQRKYRGTWDILRNYAEDEEAWHVDADGIGHYYVSLEDGNVGNDPDVATTKWAEVGEDFQRTIAWQQEGETEIGDVDLENCVFDRDPRVYRFAGAVRPVILYEDGFQVVAEEAPAQPWIRFRLPVPEYSLTEWTALTTYAIGGLCYRTSTGTCYKAITPSTGKIPEQETGSWMPVEFPDFLKTYVIWGAHADYLLDPVENGKAENKATAELERLEDELWNQPGVTRRAVFER